MEKKIMLFGPPGIGKSTIIKKLSENDAIDQIALDLESVPKEQRSRALDMGFQIFGSADLNPSNTPRKDLVWVALVMPQSDYEKRRAMRDLDRPGKASQPEMRVEQFLPGTQYVLDATLDPDQYLDAINKICWLEDISLDCVAVGRHDDDYTSPCDDRDTPFGDRGCYDEGDEENLYLDRDDPCGYGWDDDGNYMGPDECDPDSPNFDY